MKNNLIKIYKFLLCGLPVALFFSYYPVISLGTNSTMNFELSIVLIWLVIFDVVAFIMMAQQKKLSLVFSKWQWLLFPIFITASAFWSLNFMRGILTSAIVWLIYIAVFAFFSLKDFVSDKKFKRIFWRVFFVSSLIVCVWCFLQCVLDLLDLPRECSLLCPGCVYEMFGFTHPNGFAIEPQFMGNLLLAPVIISGWLIMENNCNNTFRGRVPRSRLHGAQALLLGSSLRNSLKILLPIAFFIFTATLFLTLSRGAIYAAIIALVLMTVMRIVQTKKWRAMLIWPVVILSFIFTLNMQGLMSEVSNTDETYMSGVSKVLNQLSLGIIKIEKGNDNNAEDGGEKKSDEGKSKNTNKAVFDGYVEESTSTRMRLTKDAINVWKSDFMTMVFGVGLGGAGQALYDNGLSPAPKEIVQNEYASLLLEVGLVGVALFVLTIILIIKLIIRSKNKALYAALLVAYGITLIFFSGVPNALQIYLLPGLFFAIDE